MKFSEYYLALTSGETTNVNHQKDEGEGLD